MSYQTEEVLPMLDGVNTSKKQSLGLIALMVLSLAVTSFKAGYVYSSTATASVSVPWQCYQKLNALYTACGEDEELMQCAYDHFGDTGFEADCPSDNQSPECLDSLDALVNFGCISN